MRSSVATSFLSSVPASNVSMIQLLFGQINLPYSIEDIIF